MTAHAETRLECDRIYHGDSRHMKEVPDGVVSLIVCSPPYNVKKPYTNHNDDMPLPEYENMLRTVWAECKRVLRPGGRLCVNVAGVWRQPYLPLHAVIWHQLDELGFQMRGEVIWDKGATAGVSTAWGSFASPSNPTLRDVHEHILIAARNGDGRLVTHNVVSVFSKDAFRLPNLSGGKPDITNDDFVEWTRSVWHMATESPARVGHPAPFPVDLPRRLILLYTYPGDVVLDPFAGVGSTCVAAVMTGRRYIGYDIDEEYVRIARERVREAVTRPAIPADGTDGPARRKGGGRVARAKPVLKIEATALVGSDVRDREVRVSVQEGEVVLGIKTLGEPDIQKQNLTASLSPSEAQRLATALLKAAEGLTPHS
jgi:site-specific DNA-methyltransferase (adenine-specific)